VSGSLRAAGLAPAGRVDRGITGAALLLAVVLGGAVAVGRSDVVVALAFGTFVLFAFRFRLARILGLSSFLVLIPPVAVSGLAPMYLLVAGELTLALAILVGGRSRRIDGGMLWTALAFEGAVVLAAFRGLSLPDSNASPITGALTIGAQFLLVAAGACRTSEDSELDEFAGVMSVTGVALAAWAVAEFVLDRGLAYPLMSGARRAVGPFGNPNYFGALLASVAVLCVAAAVIRRQAGRRAALPAFVGTACAAGVLMTLSRGAVLGLIAGISVLLFVGSSKRRRRWLAIALAAGLLLAGVVAWRQITAERVRVAFGPANGTTVASAAEEESLRYRYAAAELALRYALEHPWEGVGLDRFADLAEHDPRLGLYMNTHDEPLRIAAEAGIPAFLLLVLFLWMVTARIRRRDPRVVAVALPVMVCYGVVSLFLNGLENPALSFPVVAAMFLAAGLPADAHPSRRDPGRVVSISPGR